MAIFLRLTIVFVACFCSTAFAQNALKSCFTRSGNSDIFFYKPFKQEWRVTSEEGCLPLCVKFARRCKAVVYDAHTHVCRLYNQDGSQPPAFVMSAFKRVLFRVESRRCLESQGRNVQFLGARVLLPIRNSTVSVSTTRQPTEPTTTPRVPEPTTTPRVSEPTTTLRVPDDAADPPQAASTPETSFTHEEETFEIEEDTCTTQDETPLFVVFENTDMLTGDAAEPTFITNEEECRTACELGQNVNTSAVFTCNGFTHYADDNRCVIHRKQLNPPKITVSSPALGPFSARTYIKFCYPLELEAITQCAHPYFIGFREYATVGNVREEFLDLPPDYLGLKTCVELCIQSPEYSCHSASFFLDSGKCLLHDQSSLSDPENFVEHKQSNHLYFENACVGASLVNQDGEPMHIKTDRIRQEEKEETLLAPRLASVTIRRSPPRPGVSAPFEINPARIKYNPYASLYAP